MLRAGLLTAQFPKSNVAKKRFMPEKRNMLAEHRTELGYDRTILALERTMMAWIRTDLSLISFGFTIYKFLETMQQAAGGPGHGNAPRNIGMALILIGVGTLIMAMIQFRKALNKISDYTQKDRQISISVTAGIAILVVAFAMLLNMLGIWRG
jgi:putative membrane protein